MYLPNPAVPASPSFYFAGGAERPTVSDWASALSWGNDESELVTELQAGSETAFDWLVNHYHARSEEHTSELQSLRQLVCRLLLEKTTQCTIRLDANER